MSVDEKKHLEKIAAVSRYAVGVNEFTIRHSYNIFKRFIRSGSVLELGPAEGIMTDLLATLGLDLTVVEGSKLFCEDLRKRYPGLTVFENLFEEFKPQRFFDNIILGHVLEHVDDPLKILRLARGWLSNDGRIFAAVPNSRSLHRQAAVIMGLLSFEEGLNESDLHHGHRRVYNPETFRSKFIDAGLEIEIFGGYWMKPLSNSQIEATWTENMIEAFMKLGERYPDIAAEIYIIAKK